MERACSTAHVSTVPCRSGSPANCFAAALAAVLVAMLLMPPQLRAWGVAEKTGKYVVPRSRDFQFGQEKVETAARTREAYEVYRVVRSEGPKLWLKARWQKPSEGPVSIGPCRATESGD